MSTTNLQPIAASNPGPEALADRLRHAREYLGLTQEFVALQLGIPRAAVSAIESEKRKVSSRELQDLSRLYGLSVATLLNEEADGQIEDPTTRALFRATRDLTPDDKAQVIKFAEFLRTVGKSPVSPTENQEEV